MSRDNPFKPLWLPATLLMFLACTSPTPERRGATIAATDAKLDALATKVDDLQKQQALILAQQEAIKNELIKKIEESRNTYQPLKRLAEYDQERMLVETPVEKVRRAMQEVRLLATAVQTYAIDASKFPENPAATEESTISGRLGDVKLCSLSDIAKELFPAYRRGVLAWDPWGKPYMYWASPDRQNFMIVCTGEDGRLNPYQALLLSLKDAAKVSYSPKPFDLPCYETDIIWYDDGFIQRPQGPLHHCNDNQKE